jgi:hypothetical protein
MSAEDDHAEVAPQGRDGPQEAADEERQMTDEERVAALREELKKLHVADIAHDMMLSLVSLGYQKLGLTAETRELRDLDDARLAIDLLRATLEVLEKVRSTAEIEAFRSTLATMQLNYVRVATPPEPPVEDAGAGGEPAGQEVPAAAAEAPSAEAAGTDAGAPDEPQADG